MIDKFSKLVKNAMVISRNRVRKIANIWKYLSSKRYNAESYWQKRLSKYRFDLRGVGNKGLSDESNRQMYIEAKNVFLTICHDLKIDFAKSKILDIGCGTGFYAKICQEYNTYQYLGIDIVDVLFDELHEQFPNYKFRTLDITSQNVNGFYDLIIMIDVTQHITNKNKFSFAMQNIRSSLYKSGVFIVTSWLDENIRNSFYELSRSIEHYKKEFPNTKYEFTDPIPFRDKFIFVIRKRSRHGGSRV